MASDRDSLLRRVDELAAMRFGERGRALSPQRWREAKAEETLLLLEYAENLVYHPVSRCPICGEVFHLPVDLDGLDGAWWWKRCPVELPEPRGCGHYQVFLGAMDLGNREPAEATRPVLLGPARPYVIDRLLERDGVVAVLSSFTVAPGYTAWLITYFADPAIPQGDLHQEWRYETYGLQNEDGELVASENKLDPWNFDLASWAERDKLHFIRPGDNELRLRSKMPEAFAVDGGTKRMQVAARGERHLLEPPQGGETGIYDPAD